MSGTPVLVQHIQEIEKVYRGLDGMSLIAVSYTHLPEFVAFLKEED